MPLNNFDEKDLADWMAHDKILNEQVKIVDDYIVINVAYEYNISLETCSNYQQILHWAWHLTEKTWMTNDVMGRFIEVACNHHGLVYRQ